jgi:ribosomal silencing factor RsfS
VKLIKRIKFLVAALLFLLYSVDYSYAQSQNRIENVVFITGVGATQTEARRQAQMAANRQGFKTVSYSSNRNSNGDWVVILKARRGY